MPHVTPGDSGNRSRVIRTSLVTLGLATAMHLDWHAARPVIHHLSFGWTWHWLLAVPVFALTAWFVLRQFPDHAVGASLVIIGIASILAAIVEPAWEYWTGATYEWAFGRPRRVAFGAFLATGVITHTAVIWLGLGLTNRIKPAAPARGSTS